MKFDAKGFQNSIIKNEIRANMSYKYEALEVLMQILKRNKRAMPKPFILE
jgi:hypothetical protein